MPPTKGKRKKVKPSEKNAPVPGATDEIAHGDKRIMYIETMAELLAHTGHTDIKARSPDRTPPDVIKGQLEDHRPDLTCRQPSRRKTALILDTVFPADVIDDRLVNRLSLLASAAMHFKADLQFIIPTATCKHNHKTVRENLLILFREVGIDPSYIKIWEF